MLVENRLNEIRIDLIKEKNRAKEAEQKKNDLIVYMAHDLKTPLTSIIGYLTLLKDEKDISKELQERYIKIAYDKALSQKANQVEYFDNAYLKILGMQLPKDKNGNVKLDMLGNQIIYSPDNMNGNVDVGFLEKPDGDVMQENYLNRLIDNIYQVSMVSNLRDEAFSGNSSGVAIQYKMLPMQNMASTKERKFTQALRNLLAVGFKLGTIAEVPEDELYSALKFKFTRNMPRNDADEAATAATLNGIVSKETQLSVLSIVDDPKKEIERMQEEEKDGILQNIDIQNQAMKNMEGVEDEKNTEEQA